MTALSKATLTHGGPRKGAGRPKGSGTGRKVISRSVTLTPALWAKLDELRGEKSRGAFLAGLLRG
jgi:hypothetical protein